MKFSESLEIIWLMFTAASNTQAKKCRRFVTAEMRANALENVKKYSWVEQEQKNAISYAEPWVKLNDDELWNLISG